MKKKSFGFLLFATLCGFWAFVATAATSLFSDYGQIQNVQNYSSNPFWSPNAPYNQRMPQPVYVQGADLNSNDCINVVYPMVSVQCMARDNCKNTTLAEIRPEIMVQLSKLPGNNYVSGCSGFLDYIFELYVKQNGNQLPNRAVGFPDSTTPNKNLNNNTGQQLQNPYKQTVPEWQKEINERSQELQDLQGQNGAGSEHLSATDFPETYADLSFSERMKNEAKGWEPFKDGKAYYTLDVKNESEWCGDSNHYDSPECASYKARKEAEALAKAQAEAEVSPVFNTEEKANQQTVTNTTNTTNLIYRDDRDTNGLCLTTQKFNFADSAVIFKDIQVNTPNVAQQLVQEYINCSEQPDLQATINYTTVDNDDLLEIQNKQNQIVQKFTFDDVTEPNGSKFGTDTFKALCRVSSGELSKTISVRGSGTRFTSCINISANQFSKMQTLVQSLISPADGQIKGQGTFCYKMVFKKSAQTVNYSVSVGNNCVNKIFTEN